MDTMPFNEDEMEINDFMVLISISELFILLPVKSFVLDSCLPLTLVWFSMGLSAYFIATIGGSSLSEFSGTSLRKRQKQRLEN